MAGLQPIKLFVLIFLISLSACSDPIKEKITQQLPITEQRVADLGKALDNGNVKNAKLISMYGNVLIRMKPDLAPIIKELMKDAGRQGPMYKSLVDRINTVKNNPQMFANSEVLYDELMNIYQAADPILFSDALSDPLNVLADMSDGKLARVNALPKDQSLSANKAQDFGTGQQLIGNPSYGNWVTGSNGMSFWAWYGMYSMMGDVFGSRRVYYNDWGRQRNYSYYNDYGRRRYSSPTQLNKQRAVDERTRKSFQRQGKRYTSPYSKNRTGASSISRQSKSAQTSANRFAKRSSNKSSYANKSSFRNSRNTTSRSSRRGK